MRLIKIFSLVLTLIVVLASTGCVGKEIITNEGTQLPDMTVRDDIEIDWDQVEEDCEAILNQEDYPLGLYLDYVEDEEEGVTKLIWPLDDSANALDAAEYAEAYIKAFNDAIAVQDFSYAPSTDTYYGGYWDTHNLDIMVFKNNDILNPELFMVNQIVMAGSNDPINSIEYVTEEQYKEDMNAKK